MLSQRSSRPLRYSADILTESGWEAAQSFAASIAQSHLLKTCTVGLSPAESLDQTEQNGFGLIFVGADFISARIFGSIWNAPLHV